MRLRARQDVEAAHITACRRVYAYPLGHADGVAWVARRDALAWMLGWTDTLGDETTAAMRAFADAERDFEGRR